jgi:hypothetical protein
LGGEVNASAVQEVLKFERTVDRGNGAKKAGVY